jgi:hypothetical protein
MFHMHHRVRSLSVVCIPPTSKSTIAKADQRAHLIIVPYVPDLRYKKKSRGKLLGD